MALPPLAQSCSNCTNYINNECHYQPYASVVDGARQAAGGYHIERYSVSITQWPPTQPDEWCAQWDK